MGRLNLSRRPGESILIGEHGDIQITVVRVRGHAVDLVVDADNAIPVDRKEVFLARKHDREQMPHSSEKSTELGSD